MGYVSVVADNQDRRVVHYMLNDSSQEVIDAVGCGCSAVGSDAANGLVRVGDGGLVAWVIATTVLGSKAAAWFFVPPFLVSTIGGSIIAGLLLKTGVFKSMMDK